MPNLLLTTALVLILFLVAPAHAEDLSLRLPDSVDVFTTEMLPIESVDEVVDSHPGLAIRVHLLDAIERLEDQLSRGLSTHPEQAKRQALERLRRLPTENRAQLESTARGLALAMELGIDRYPAVVFNRQLVVYGVTDLSRAISHYRTWQSKDES